MKIAKELPQFNKEKALIVLTGIKDGAFYSVHRGVIEKLDSFVVERPQYADRGGFFAVSGRGQMFGVGAPTGTKDRNTQIKFSQQLRERLEGLADQNWQAVYLISPRPTRSEVRRALPAILKKIVRGEVDGDFVDKHPFEFLKKMKKMLMVV